MMVHRGQILLPLGKGACMELFRSMPEALGLSYFLSTLRAPSLAHAIHYLRSAHNPPLQFARSSRQVLATRRFF